MDYFIADQEGNQEGPYSRAEIEEKVAYQGLIPEETLGWTEGSKTWVPLNQLLRSSSSVAPGPVAPPPVPQSNETLKSDAVIAALISLSLYALSFLLLAATKATAFFIIFAVAVLIGRWGRRDIRHSNKSPIVFIKWLSRATFTIGTIIYLLLIILFVIPAVKKAVERAKYVAENQQNTDTDDKIVFGGTIQYSFTIPNGWASFKNPSAFDLFLQKRPLYIGVIAKKSSDEDNIRYAEHALNELKKTAKILDSSEPVETSIDGRVWLRFIVQFEKEDETWLSIYHVYSGPEGAFQVIGFTSVEPLKENMKEILAVMKTFRFPQ